MQNPLFNGSVGRYDGIPEEEVIAIRNLASKILCDATIACISPEHCEKLKAIPMNVIKPFIVRTEEEANQMTRDDPCGYKWSVGEDYYKIESLKK